MEKNKKRSTNEIEQAEILSEFFSEVMEEEPEGDIPYLPPVTLTAAPLNDITATSQDIEKRLQKLDVTKSSGPDKIHSRVLKEAKIPISKALAIIYQHSLSTGQVPKEWKSATITPIFKKGKKKLPGNNRPVSLTSLLCKILKGFERNALPRIETPTPAIISYRGASRLICNT